MLAFRFLLMAILALVFSFSVSAEDKPRRAQNNRSLTKKVWTNDDIDNLRAQGLISIVGPEFPEGTSQPAPVQLAPPGSRPAFPVYNSRLEDPVWYLQQVAGLQAELDRREAALRDEMIAIDLAARGITEPGIALDRPNVGVTPQDGLAILEARVNEVQNQINELSDLARMHDIPPGVLRV